MFGTLPYIPPQILKLKKYNPHKKDIWELGVLIFILNTGVFPYNTPINLRIKKFLNDGYGKYKCNDSKWKSEPLNLILNKKWKAYWLTMYLQKKH